MRKRGHVGPALPLQNGWEQPILHWLESSLPSLPSGRHQLASSTQQVFTTRSFLLAVHGGFNSFSNALVASGHMPNRQPGRSRMSKSVQSPTLSRTFQSPGSGSLRDVDVQLDAAVLRAALGGRVVGDGIGRARSLDEHLPLADAAARQNVAHRLRPAQR